MCRLGRVALAMSLVVCGCERVSVYEPNHVHLVDVSPDGKYLATLSLAGRIDVWDLDSKSLLLSLSHQESDGFNGDGFSAVAFRGTRGELLSECKPGFICSLDLETGVQAELFRFADASDRARLLLASRDGSRVVVGTVRGMLAKFDATRGKFDVLKPTDIWTGLGKHPWPMFLLEGTPDLSVFSSASENGVAAASEESSGTVDADGFVEVNGHRAARWRGVVLWKSQHDSGHVLTTDIGYRVRGDFRPDGRELALCEEGGPWIVVNTDDLTLSRDMSLDRASIPSCYGMRYLDPSGDFLGITGGREARLWLARRGAQGGHWEDAGTLRLRRIPGLGPRSMTALPEKGWLFVGLMNGGVDWYAFKPAPRPRLEFLTHLAPDS